MYIICLLSTSCLLSINNLEMLKTSQHKNYIPETCLLSGHSSTLRVTWTGGLPGGPVVTTLCLSAGGVGWENQDAEEQPEKVN